MSVCYKFIFFMCYLAIKRRYLNETPFLSPKQVNVVVETQHECDGNIVTVVQHEMADSVHPIPAGLSFSAFDVDHLSGNEQLFTGPYLRTNNVQKIYNGYADILNNLGVEVEKLHLEDSIDESPVDDVEPVE